MSVIIGFLNPQEKIQVKSFINEEMYKALTGKELKENYWKRRKEFINQLKETYDIPQEAEFVDGGDYWVNTADWTIRKAE